MAAERPYQLIVFDWDGTLYDSLAFSMRHLRQAVNDMNWPQFSEEAIRCLTGLGISELLERLYPAASFEDLNELRARYRAYTLRYRDELTLCAGAKELLELLKAQGYTLAIATGKAAAGLARDLQSAGLQHLFAITRSADQTFSKPHPLMLEQIMEICAEPRQKTLMIGDSLFDIQMANNAFVDSIGVANFPEQASILLAEGAKAVVQQLSELAQYLQQV